MGAILPASLRSGALGPWGRPRRAGRSGRSSGWHSSTSAGASPSPRCSRCSSRTQPGSSSAGAATARSSPARAWSGVDGEEVAVRRSPRPTMQDARSLLDAIVGVATGSRIVADADGPTPAVFRRRRLHCRALASAVLVTGARRAAGSARADARHDARRDRGRDPRGVGPRDLGRSGRLVRVESARAASALSPRC